MPDLPWNHVYTEADAIDVLLSPATYRTIAKATNEKLLALRLMPIAEEPAGLAGYAALGAGAVELGASARTATVTADNGGASYTIETVDEHGYADSFDATSYTTIYPDIVADAPFAPDVGDTVIESAGAIFPTDYPGHPWSWPALLSLLCNLAGSFIDPDTWTDPAGYNPFDSSWPLPSQLDVAAILADKAGFTRRVERRICSLDDAGEAGQRARFIYATAPIDDLINTPAGPTPAGQAGYSTRVMVHDGEAWTVETDATQQPDQLEIETNPPGDLGLPRPGDIFGHWIINDAQKVIGSYRWQHQAAGCSSDDGSNTAELHSAIGDYTTEADARDATEAMWPGAAGPVTFSDIVGEQYYASAYVGSEPFAEYFITISNRVAAPACYGLGTNCARTVDFWWSAGPPNPREFTTYDDNGTGLANGVWGHVGTYGPGAAAPAVGPDIGSASHMPTEPAPTDLYARGYIMDTDGLALIKWDVTGGFQYLTP